jgi:pyruvate/2-oxoglutarate dehydrogenase complex dihydrolipoamide dehydrogenase (E3) component
MPDPNPLLPDDPHDRQVVANTRPPDWRNPRPAGRYDLVVLGGGTAGLVAAGVAGLLGARVALVERALAGGDCLVAGCVPSKAVVRAGRAAYDVARAGDFGVRVPPGVAVDFAAAFDRMRRARAEISRHDAVAAFAAKYRVDVFLGDGRFAGPDAVEVAGEGLRFARAVVATGGRPAVPDVPGLADAGFLTNESVFNLTARPSRLAVLGAGPIGCELGQAFARLGSSVTVVDRGDRPLSKEDPAAANLIAAAMRRDGVDLVVNATVIRVERDGAGARVLRLRTPAGERALEVDAILVAAGRRPNVEALNLEAGRIAFTGRGVTVDDYLRTSNPRVYAAGDVCLAEKFTYAADAAARLAVQNALVGRLKRWSRQRVPRVTYTDPEVAHVGLTEPEAARAGVPVRAHVVPLADVDRAATDGETDGFVKLLTRGRTDRIVGATIVGRHAGETISQVTTAMAAGVGLRALSAVIHPYPTQAEAIRKAADAYVAGTLGPTLKWALRRWMGWRR